jgi:hypothetical protein
MNKAIAFQVWVFIIGFLVSNLPKRDFDPIFRTLIALPMGWAIFAVCATVVYSVHFSAISQLVLLGVLGVITLTLVATSMIRGRLSRGSILLGGASLVVLTTACWVVELLRIVIMTPDSTSLVRFGQNIGLGNYEASKIIFSKWGPFVPFIHSITNVLDQKLYWQYQALLSLNLVGIVFYTVYTALREQKTSWQSFVTALIVVSLMTLSNIFLFHMFYIHVNMISALYMYLFVFALAKIQQGAEKAYELLALLSLVAFSLVRLEAPLFAIVIMLVACFQPGWSYGKRLRLVAPFVGFCVAWYGRVYFMLPETPDILSQNLIVAFSSILLGFGLFVAFSNVKALDSLVKRTPVVTLIGLSLISIIFTATRPEHMLGSLLSMVQNILVYGNWGLTWYVIVIIAVELYFARMGSTKHQWIFTLLVSYVLLVYNLAYFIKTPYHTGEVDSANRLLLQSLPLVLLYLSTRQEWLETPVESRSLSAPSASGVLFPVVHDGAPTRWRDAL